MTRKPLQPLSDAEATRLGQLAARALGEGPDAERLAAQRLRLAQLSVPPPSNPGSGRFWAVGGGVLAAALTVGAVVLVGKWRSEERLAASRHPVIVAEPLAQRGSAPQSAELTADPPEGRDDARGEAPSKALGRWRWVASSAKGRRSAETAEPSEIAVGQRLDARAFALSVELDGANGSPDARGAAQLKLERGAQARVVQVSQEALVVGLEHGRANAAAAKSTPAVVVLAGPFTVRPAPAAASVSPKSSASAETAAYEPAEYETVWAPKANALRLTVKRGRVEVVSEDGRAPQFFAAGKSFQLTASRRGRWLVADDDPKRSQPDSRDERNDKSGPVRDAEPPSGAAGHEKASSVEPSVPEPGAVTSRGHGLLERQAPLADETEWRKLAENGQYAAAVKAAEQVGFARLEEASSPSDLLLLADTARLGGATQKAKSVLTALRQRYPGHTNSATAAFTLGRIAQEQEHDDRRAISWYRTYLREEPSGRMAEGARARLLKATLRVGSALERTEAAHDYLAHHPTGSSAAVARSVLGK